MVSTRVCPSGRRLPPFQSNISILEFAPAVLQQGLLFPRCENDLESSEKKAYS